MGIESWKVRDDDGRKMKIRDEEKKREKREREGREQVFVGRRKAVNRRSHLGLRTKVGNNTIVVESFLMPYLCGQITHRIRNK